MRPFPPLFAAAAAFALAACQDPQPTAPPEQVEEPTATAPATPTAHPVVRIQSTLQNWSTTRPWEKSSAYTRGGLGVVIEGGRILTVAEMVTNAVLIELSDAQGLDKVLARVEHIDHGANLALLKPIVEGEATETFLDAIAPATLSETIDLGESVDIIQLEDSGDEVISSATLQSYDVSTTMVAGEFQLVYRFKSSLQSATDSFTVPAFAGEQLAGLLYSYDSDDQVSIVLPNETIRAFIADADDGDYLGFPVLGMGTSVLDDKNFRSYLELPDDRTGLYISSIRSDSPAANAGLQKGDVMLGINGHSIDSLGYYEDETYGRISWINLIRTRAKAGDEVTVDIIRDGQPQTITATLGGTSALERLIEKNYFDSAPGFYITGGLIFQELSVPFMERFGEKWRTNSPLDLLRLVNDPTLHEGEGDRVIVLAAVIATPATVGYEQLRNKIVTEVNGKPIGSIADLDAAFGQIGATTHTIGLDAKPDKIYLDARIAAAVDQQLTQRGIPMLKRIPSAYDEE